MTVHMKESPSTAHLVGQLAEQVSRLVRDELTLARLEMADKAKHAGLGAGLFGGAGLIAFFGGGALVAAVIMLLALALPGWVAAAIVGAVLLAAAAVLGLVGRKQVSQVAPPMPKETLRSVKADIDTVRERVHQ